MPGNVRSRIAVLFLGLVVAIAPARTAEAGKNANGAMVVHTNDSVAYTVSGQYCGVDFSDPGTCEASGTRTDKDEATPAVVWLLAAFDAHSSPGVSVVYFGIEHNLPPGLGYIARWSFCGPANTLEVPDPGWPETGFGNSIAFGSPVMNDRLFPFYWFAAYGFPNAFLGTGINPTGGYAGFVDDGHPGVLDECFRFGRVRWYASGFNDCPVASDCQITIVAPNGGENWGQGTLHAISWNSTECDGPVRIELLRNGLVCQTIAGDAPNSGSYPWIAQQCNSNPGGYKIRVTDLVSGAEDASNGSFSIPAGSCQLAVTAPGGGAAVEAGLPYEILWGSGGTCGTAVKIELVLNGEVCRVVAASTPNDGSYLWTPDRCDPDGCGYKIRITDLASSLADESDGTFCIRRCDLTVTSPNGGESWDAGSEYPISWDSADCGAAVRVDLLLGGTVCTTIAESTPNDGSHLWIAEQCDGNSEGYKIRITDLDGGWLDESDQPFRIEGCEIVVTSPNGGESWPEGTEQTITWDSSLCGSEVKIELLRDGAVCALIAGSTANDEFHLWTSAPCDDAAAGYAIRITDLTSGKTGESDGTFSIPLCWIDVTAPNGGEAWISGSERTILWDTSDCGDTVGIELLHEEVVCRTIAASTPNDGSFAWIAEGCQEQTTGYKVRLTDLRTGRSDESDASFTIPVCELTVAAPDGGELWIPGDVVSIRWESVDCGDAVSIDLLHEGEICLTIDGSTPNDGDRPWIVESCGGNPTGYRIRVTDLVSGSSDESDSEFCIGCATGTFYFADGLEIAQGRQNVELIVYGLNSDPIRGYAINFCFDASVFECVSMSLEGTRGEGASEFEPVCGADCARAGVVFSTSCPPQIDGGDGGILRVVVNVREDAPLGPTALDLTDVGPAFNTMTPCVGPTFSPALLDGTVEILRESFRRGDDDASGRIDILDPIHCLAHQFAGGPVPPCSDAGDFDDSGRYDISDCIANLCYQFGDCPEPPPPFVDCGPDPTGTDTLGCLSFQPCGTGGGRLSVRRTLDPEEGAVIRLGAITRTAGDTVGIPIELLSSSDLAALQFTVRFEPAVLDYLDLRKPESGLDFLSGRPDPSGGIIRIGVVPDLQLSEPLEPGRHTLGRIRFHVVSIPGESGSRIDIIDGLGVGADRIPYALIGEGIALGGESGPGDDGLWLGVPNPFPPNSSLSLGLAAASLVRISIYNVLGQKVRTLWHGELPRGRHALRWDGRTDGGAIAGSGIYYLRADVDGRRIERKLALVR